MASSLVRSITPAHPGLTQPGSLASGFTPATPLSPASRAPGASYLNPAAATLTPLPNDYARCPGWSDDPVDWLDECQDCQRRTASAGDQWMTPPTFVVLWCEAYIPPDRPEDKHLRELAKQQGLTT